MSAFTPLLNKTWKAEGNWGDGSVFKQEVIFEKGLGKNMIIAKSRGFTNQKQTEYGDRNFGIRRYDPNTGEMKFWEFDVFGGLTEGRIEVDGKDIYYHYEYGETSLTDHWAYQDENTYGFTVGVLKDGKWQQKFLSATFEAIDAKVRTELPEYKKHLEGTWIAPAWDGVLKETWHVGQDGHLHQTAEYIEDGQVLYASASKIEKVGDDLILFSVIKDSNPKIFKATSFSAHEIIFENTEYSNPNKVIYTFDDKGPFKRTISGIEQEKPTTYTFDFVQADEQ